MTEVVKRMAIAFPGIRFTLSGQDRTTLEFAGAGDDRLTRIAQVLGREFKDNAIEIDAEREDVTLTGFAGLPTFNRGNSAHQYLFVNGRPVQDRQLLSALRAAYAETVPSGRHPVAVLWLTLDPALVDVNVHPAKSDVRFRDPGLVRGLLIGAIREALQRDGARASTTGTSAMMQAFRPAGNAGGFGGSAPAYRAAPNAGWSPQASPFRPLREDRASGFAEALQAGFEAFATPSARADLAESQPAPSPQSLPTAAGFHLGAARAQVHENYIVAQTEDGLVIVDQHAAHERLVFEAMREAMRSRRIPSQALLIPEIVDLPEEDCDRLMDHAASLDKFGLAYERFGPGAIAIRETPAMLGEIDASGLIRQLADEIAEWDTSDTLASRLDHLAATMSCHGSVRSGRRLRPEEMNALLRQMEDTPGQANAITAGRPI